MSEKPYTEADMQSVRRAVAKADHLANLNQATEIIMQAIGPIVGRAVEAERQRCAEIVREVVDDWRRDARIPKLSTQHYFLRVVGRILSRAPASQPDPSGKVRCPDPECAKLTDPGDACEHCGCPLTPEARADLIEGLAAMQCLENVAWLNSEWDAQQERIAELERLVALKNDALKPFADIFIGKEEFVARRYKESDLCAAKSALETTKC